MKRSWRLEPSEKSLHSNWEGQRLDLPTIIEILHQYLPKPDPTPADSAESYEPDSAESSA